MGELRAVSDGRLLIEVVDRVLDSSLPTREQCELLPHRAFLPELLAKRQLLLQQVVSRGRDWGRLGSQVCPRRVVAVQWEDLEGWLRCLNCLYGLLCATVLKYYALLTALFAAAICPKKRRSGRLMVLFHD